MAKQRRKSTDGFQRDKAHRIAAKKMNRNTASEDEMSMAGSKLNPSMRNSQRIVEIAVDVVDNPEEYSDEALQIAEHIEKNDDEKAEKARSVIAERMERERKD